MSAIYFSLAKVIIIFMYLVIVIQDTCNFAEMTSHCIWCICKSFFFSGGKLSYFSFVVWKKLVFSENYCTFYRLFCGCICWVLWLSDIYEISCWQISLCYRARVLFGISLVNYVDFAAMFVHLAFVPNWSFWFPLNLYFKKFLLSKEPE